MTAIALASAGPDPTLPGLDLVGERLQATTAMEREAVAHIQALQAAGRVGPGDRLLVALVLDLARTVGLGAATGKAAGVAMAARQLLDAMAQLPPLEAETEADDWAAVVAALATR